MYFILNHNFYIAWKLYKSLCILFKIWNSCWKEVQNWWQTTSKIWKQSQKVNFLLANFPISLKHVAIIINQIIQSDNFIQGLIWKACIPLWYWKYNYCIHILSSLIDSDFVEKMDQNLTSSQILMFILFQVRK